MELQNALGFPGAHGRPITKVRDAADTMHSVQRRLGHIDSVRWETVRCARSSLPSGIQVCFPILSCSHGAENGVFAPEHLRRLCSDLRLHGATNRRAAHDFAIHCHRRNADDIEIRSRAELFQQSEIARAVFPKRPLVSDANFAQRLRMFHQLLHEVFGRGRGELLVEM